MAIKKRVGGLSGYKARTARSRKAFKVSKKLHVNGVHHNIRYFDPYPFVTRSARGSCLVDLDSNRYTDYWMGHWSLILGHRPAQVQSALRRQINDGWMYGTVNSQTMLLSEIIAGAVPVAEKIRYMASGTEAAMYAVRLARSFAGKSVVAKVDGGWHGYTSDLLKTVNWPFSEPESSGLGSQDDLISIPYNDLSGSLEILNRVRDDLACIIVEPVLGGGGCIVADTDYLAGLQEFVHRNGSLFVLDEIVTGFRFRFGCLYEQMGLNPDMVTLGKIIGGGMPIGAIAGKDEIMNIADTTKHAKAQRAYVGGGTFSANPATMAAGHATLKEIKRRRSVYTKIGRLGDLARNRLESVFDGRVRTTGMGSLFMTHFVEDGADVRNAADAASADTKILHDYHTKMITDDGIFFLPGKLGAFSSAHDMRDLNRMLEASESFSAGLGGA